jgi:hypothetical protein
MSEREARARATDSDRQAHSQTSFIITMKMGITFLIFNCPRRMDMRVVGGAMHVKPLILILQELYQ